MKTPSNHETDALFSRFGIQRNVRPQGRLELWARCAFRLIREIRAEACSRTGIPWRRCLRAWRHGFRPVYAAVYGLDETDPAFFVPDFAYAYRCYRMNGFWNPIIGNKLVVSDVLSAHGIPHPHVLGIVARGRLIEAGGLAREANAALLDRWTQNGNGYSLIEANAPPGIVVSQVHAPLLANPRVAGYFRRHGFRVPDGTRPYPCDPQTADREP